MKDAMNAFDMSETINGIKDLVCSEIRDMIAQQIDSTWYYDTNGNMQVSVMADECLQVAQGLSMALDVINSLVIESNIELIANDGLVVDDD